MDEADIEMNSYTTVVDVNKCRMYLKNFGEFYSNQVETAGAIILSRTDVAKEGKAEAAVKLLREMNPHAAIVTTPIEQLDGAKLLETMEHVDSLEKQMLEEEAHRHEHHHDHGPDCTCGCHDHDHSHQDHHGHHHADEVFTSWGKETIKKYNKEELKVKLAALESEDVYGVVLRAKGMVAGDDGRWIYFDMVPGEREVRDGEPEFTGRICVIGSGLKEDALAELFEV